MLVVVRTGSCARTTISPTGSSVRVPQSISWFSGSAAMPLAISTMAASGSAVQSQIEGGHRPDLHRQTVGLGDPLGDTKRRIQSPLGGRSRSPSRVPAARRARESRRWPTSRGGLRPPRSGWAWTFPGCSHRVSPGHRDGTAPGRPACRRCWRAAPSGTRAAAPSRRRPTDPDGPATEPTRSDRPPRLRRRKWLSGA